MVVSLDQPIYLLDANAIRELSYNFIKENTETKRLATIDEVFYEVSGLKKASLVPVYGLGADAFVAMRNLLAKHDSVRTLLSYHGYKGAADVAILAYVLTANDGKMIADDYVVVTEDRGLRAACDELKVIWISSKTLKQR